MGEDFIPLETTDKKQKYNHILEELEYRIEESNHPQSNRNNLLALLRAEFQWWWIGYYFVHKDKLVLGGFQGPPACTKIFMGHGVCGTCWKQNKSIVVKNVNEFQGHIACSSKSQSEIVIPIRRGQQFIGLLDIDSEKLADFDEVDQQNLQKIIERFEKMDQFADWK